MAFLSQRDQRQRLQSFVPAGPKVAAPEFGEVFGASVGQVIDEGLSISSLLNNEGYDQRKRQVRDYGYADQFNIKDYTRDYGVLDYDRLSTDYPDLEIKTDRQLYDERNAVLKQRREYAQDVIERGSGMAQFLGYGAYMLDPINIATMPIATAGVAAKSLGAIGYALNVAGRTAGIAAASELAIQPLVYQHKHDINSPYEFSDALAAVTMAATGGAVLGGVVGGISGYFRKVRATAETQALDNDARAAIQYLERLEDQLNSNPVKVKAPSEIIKERLAAAEAEELAEFDSIAKMEEALYAERSEYAYAEMASDYSKFKQGEINSLVSNRARTVETFEARIRQLEKTERRASREVAELGGLNRAAWEKEGVDPAFFTDREIKGGFGKPVFRVNGGMTPDDLAEQLYQRNLIDSVDANKAIRFVDDMLADGNDFISAEVRAELEMIGRTVNELQTSLDDDVLEKVYFQAVKQEIQSDAEFLSQINAKMEAMNPPSKEYDNYIAQERASAPPATASSRQREGLARRGIDTDYDQDMAAYNKLDNPHIVQDGEIVPAGDFMKGLDDEMKALDEIMVCAIG